LNYDYKDIKEGIKNGKRKSIAKALTMVERQNLNFKELIYFLSELPSGMKTIRIAVTGSPGVGKSTFIEKLGFSLINIGKKIAVIAIDPSSHQNKGSILGDKTRMPSLSASPNAFIRPSPNLGESGGIRNSVFNSIKIFEAAGFDIIIIESVGVGQSEIAVKMISDLFILLLDPGAGDELQGIKKGIVEEADIILINKNDGNLKTIANRTFSDYAHAIHLSNYQSKYFEEIPILKISSIEGTGIDKVKQLIVSLLNNNEFREKTNEFRKVQEFKWMEDQIKAYITQLVMKKMDFPQLIAHGNNTKLQKTNIYQILMNVIHEVDTKFEL
jgi:LAO/AO transport system kinase